MKLSLIEQSYKLLIPTTDLVNYKATNLYEFIINSLIYGKDDVISGSFRKVIDSNRVNSYTKTEFTI